MSIVMGLNDMFGGYLIPAIVTFIGVSYLAKAAIAAKNATIAANVGLEGASFGAKVKNIGLKIKDNYLTWLGVGAKQAENLTKTEGIAVDGAAAAAEAATTTAKGGGIVASMGKVTGLIAEKGATLASSAATKGAALVERGWAVTKWAIVGVSKLMAGALGLSALAAWLSVPANTAAAGGETALGTAGYFALVPVGLLAIAIGIAALAVALFAVAVVALVGIFLEFLKFLIESPERIILAVIAFAVLAVGLSALAFAMQFVGISAVLMAVGLFVMLSILNTAAPLMLGFMVVALGITFAVMMLAVAFGFLGASMALIAVSMASMVKSTAQMVSGSGLLDFRAALSELIEDMEELEAVLGVMVAFASVSTMLNASLAGVAGSLFFMSFALSIVTAQMSELADTMAGMEDSTMAFESLMTTSMEVTPANIENIEGLVDQAWRYTQSQIELNSIGGIFASAMDSFTDMLGAATGAGAEGGKPQEIVLVLNDREFGRAVMEKVDKKMDLSTR